MKVYVDELPKCCLECQLQCPYEDRCVDTITMNCSECIGRPTDCPLQSLADYTKQVRKEVLGELKGFVKEKESFEIGDYPIIYSDDILDKIKELENRQ